MSKKPPKKDIPYWKKKAWDAFSRYIRTRDAIKTTGGIDYCVCISCGQTKPAFGIGCIQAGHFVPSRRNSVLFDEECVNGQCYGCNCGQGGMWVEYEEIMVRRHGRKKVEEMKRRKHETVKYTAGDLEEIRDKYKQKEKDLIEKFKKGE